MDRNALLKAVDALNPWRKLRTRKKRRLEQPLDGSSTEKALDADGAQKPSKENYILKLGARRTIMTFWMTRL